MEMSTTPSVRRNTCTPDRDERGEASAPDVAGGGVAGAPEPSAAVPGTEDASASAPVAAGVAGIDTVDVADGAGAPATTVAIADAAVEAAHAASASVTDRARSTTACAARMRVMI